MSLISPTERSSARGNPSRPSTNRRTQVPPLLALPACAPPLFNRRASTPESAEAPPSGRRFHPTTSRSVPVVSHHLDGFLRAATAGLLHPAASHEVHRVSRESTTWHTRRRSSRWLRFPRHGSHPSKGSPHRQPRRITAARCPLAVRRRPPRPIRGRGRVRTEWRPKPPLGCVPSEEALRPSMHPGRGRCACLCRRPKWSAGTKARCSHTLASTHRGELRGVLAPIHTPKCASRRPWSGRDHRVVRRTRPALPRQRSGCVGPFHRGPFPDPVVKTAPEDASTSRRFSIDESVLVRRRFQRKTIRSSHGLCSSPRFPRPSPSPA
jgi:hypothetical protein